MLTPLSYRLPGALLCILVISTSTGCKKKDTAANLVRFSINDSLPATCSMPLRPGQDYLGGDNCEFGFDYVGKFATGESAEIGSFLEYNCDLKTAPLPYTTRNFSVGIIVYKHPWESISYDYEHNRYNNQGGTVINTPGDMVLTITERDNNRVRGTIKGTFYGYDELLGGNYPIPGKLDCSFDLAIPVIK